VQGQGTHGLSGGTRLPTFHGAAAFRESWAVEGAEETKAACQTVAKRLADASIARPDWKRERGTAPGGAETVIFTTPDERLHNSWQCLPAGNDPRPRYKA
jgi:hypothetical protein